VTMDTLVSVTLLAVPIRHAQRLDIVPHPPRSRVRGTCINVNDCTTTITPAAEKGEQNSSVQLFGCVSMTARTVASCGVAGRWQESAIGAAVRVYDDAAAEAMVANSFPKLLPIFRGYRVPVERADLFRYLIVAKLGGVYVDCDVEPKMPVDRWMESYGWKSGSGGFNASRNTLVVGIEFPIGAVGNPIQIVQWAFAATQPRHPALMHVIDEVARVAKIIEDDEQHVERHTGPVVWTHALLSYMQQHNASGLQLLNATELDKRGQLIDLHDRVSGEESQLLLLPYRAMAAPGWSQLPSIRELPTWQKLLTHLFSGSWKSGPLPDHEGADSAALLQRRV